MVFSSLIFLFAYLPLTLLIYYAVPRRWRNLALFAVSLLAVAHVLHWGIAFAVTLAACLLVNRSVLKKVDYSLLATFVGFFVFVGNMGRIEAFLKERK